MSAMPPRMCLSAVKKLFAAKKLRHVLAVINGRRFDRRKCRQLTCPKRHVFLAFRVGFIDNGSEVPSPSNQSFTGSLTAIKSGRFDCPVFCDSLHSHRTVSSIRIFFHHPQVNDHRDRYVFLLPIRLPFIVGPQCILSTQRTLECTTTTAAKLLRPAWQSAGQIRADLTRSQSFTIFPA